MKAIVQRVSSTSVRINGSIHANIDHGICVLVGYCKGDNESVNIWFVEKLLGLRIFEDDHNKMNLSLQDIQGSILIIPNFTLCADTQKDIDLVFLELNHQNKQNNCIIICYLH